METKKVGVISLGCSKNLVDTENMLGSVVGDGFVLTPNLDEAEVILVNTCGFINPAKEESIQTILEASAYKERANCKLLAVTGCLVERYQQELEAEFPEVDVFLGFEDQKKLSVTISDRLNLSPNKCGVQEKDPRAFQRVITTPKHYAYLKISEGCDQQCSFCAIPNIRGKLLSKSPTDLVTEAQFLENIGILELNLISQDTTSYGRDLNGNGTNLDGLLKMLLKETGIPWIRIFYLYPALLKDSTIDLIANEERILNYIDLPIQHISDKMLKLMRRGTRRKQIEKLIFKIRDRIPDVILRTTLIVGFPGEDDKDFGELLDFVGGVKFDRVGVFAYSYEEGTASAELPYQISNHLKNERLDTIMDIQREISRELNQKYLGQRIRVLVDSKSDDPAYGYIARSWMHAVDVDGIVYLKDDGYKIGQFYDIDIIETLDYDLLGISEKLENGI